MDHIIAIGIFHSPYYALIILTLLGLVMPLSIFVGRRNVRIVRLRMLDNLGSVLNPGAPLPASFEVIRARYKDAGDDNKGKNFAWSIVKEIGIYMLPTISFAILSACGFALVLHIGENWGDAAALLMRGLHGVGDKKIDDEVATGLVVGSAFVGAYVWSIRYLILRIGNFDLSPLDFLETSAHVITTVLAAWVLRQVIEFPSGITAAILLGIAFISGFYPGLGLNVLIDRLPNWLRLKRDISQASDIARSFPLDLIDGINSSTKFRLNSLEIGEVQNLASANPVELFVMTPYDLSEILDWMSQAQLLAELGPERFLLARQRGVRDMSAFLKLGFNDVGRNLLMPIVNPKASTNTEEPITHNTDDTVKPKQPPIAPPIGRMSDAELKVYIDAIEQKVYVCHLEHWRTVLTKALVTPARPSRILHLQIVGMA